MPVDPAQRFTARKNTPRRRRRLVGIAVALGLLCLVGPWATGAQSSSFVAGYDVPGSPSAVAAESPSRIWFTLPAEGAIGQLDIAGDGTPTVLTHAAGAGCAPSDLAVVDGAVWWICASGEAIARRDAATGETRAYPLSRHTTVPLLQAGPTGAADAVAKPDSGTAPHLAILPSRPNEVWFTLPAAGKIGRLAVSDDLATSTVSHYAVPGDLPEPNDIAVQDALRVWLTVPNQSRVYQFRVGTSMFFPVSTDIGSCPWSITAEGGSPWFTDIAGARRQLEPQHTEHCGVALAPAGLEPPVRRGGPGGYVWFSEEAGQRLGRTEAVRFRAIEETGLPGAAPARKGSRSTAPAQCGRPRPGRTSCWPGGLPICSVCTSLWLPCRSLRSLRQPCHSRGTRPMSSSFDSRVRAVALAAVLVAVALLAGPSTARRTVAAQGTPSRLTIPLVMANKDYVSPHPFGVQMYGSLDDAVIGYGPCARRALTLCAGRSAGRRSSGTRDPYRRCIRGTRTRTWSGRASWG